MKIKKQCNRDDTFKMKEITNCHLPLCLNITGHILIPVYVFKIHSIGCRKVFGNQSERQTSMILFSPYMYPETLSLITDEELVCVFHKYCDR